MNNLSNNPDDAFNFVKDYLKSNPKYGIIGAIEALIKSIGSSPTFNYPNYHIISHLFGLLNNGPYSLFDFETSNEYEKLLIKSCKVRSYFRNWKNKFSGNCQTLIIDILKSEINELIDNMCILNISDDEYFIDLFETLSPDTKYESLTKIVDCMSSDEKKKLMSYLLEHL